MLARAIACVIYTLLIFFVFDGFGLGRYTVLVISFSFFSWWIFGLLGVAVAKKRGEWFMFGMLAGNLLVFSTSLVMFAGVLLSIVATLIGSHGEFEVTLMKHLIWLAPFAIFVFPFLAIAIWLTALLVSALVAIFMVVYDRVRPNSRA